MIGDILKHIENLTLTTNLQFFKTLTGHKINSNYFSKRHESNRKRVSAARKGLEVCLKLEPLPGETKMFGRHFDAKDMLLSKITRESIDACKARFRLNRIGFL